MQDDHDERSILSYETSKPPPQGRTLTTLAYKTILLVLSIFVLVAGSFWMVGVLIDWKNEGFKSLAAATACLSLGAVGFYISAGGSFYKH